MQCEGEKKWFVNLIDTIHSDAPSGRFTQSDDGAYIATANASFGIVISSYYPETNELKPVMTLDGHRVALSLLTFSHNSEPVLLISSAKDYIIKWNITECLINQHNGVAVRGSVVMQSPTQCVAYIAWSCDDTVLALCTGCDVIVYNLPNSGIAHELHGHTDAVTCAAFCPHYDTTLVTASADRTYMIWNTENGDLLYRSSIISSSPFEHLVMSENREEFVLVSSDGMVRFYDISSDSDFSQLKFVDLDKTLNRLSELKDELVSYSVCVLSMVSLCISLDIPDTGEETPEEDRHVVRSLFGMLELLLIITSSHLLILNTRTGEIISANQLTDFDVGYISDVSLCLTSSDADLEPCYTVQCVARRLLDYQLRMSCVRPLEAYLATQCADSNLSVINKVPVQADSPLRSSLIPKKAPKTSSKPKLGSKSKQVHHKLNAVHNHPVVYRSKVRSSGYAATHNKRTMFQPKTKQQVKPNPSRRTSGGTSGGTPNPKGKAYPADALPVCKLIGQTVNVDTRPTQVTQMNVSVDGQGLALACSNSQAYTFKLPLSNNKTSVYSGHSGVVQSCSWSYSGQLLVTASKDRTVRVWNKDQGTPVLTLDRVEGNITPSSQVESRKQQGLPSEVRHSQFFYLDKFVLAACGNSVLLYKYHIDTSKDDIKRYENKSRYKLASQLGMESAQHITAMSAVNTFYSHLVLTAGSDRSIQVFDMNKSTQTTVVKDCHSRPAHHITQNEGSLYSSLPYSTYDLYITSAVGDGVKLWDLRTQSCIRKFESHVSKAFPCTCDFSADGRYVSSGSEDNSFYVYDIGTGKVVSRVKDPADVCTNVVYHPLYNQLVACTITGKVALYES